MQALNQMEHDAQRRVAEQQHRLNTQDYQLKLREEALETRDKEAAGTIVIDSDVQMADTNDANKHTAKGAPRDAPPPTIAVHAPEPELPKSQHDNDTNDPKTARYDHENKQAFDQIRDMERSLQVEKLLANNTLIIHLDPLLFARMAKKLDDEYGQEYCNWRKRNLDHFMLLKTVLILYCEEWVEKAIGCQCLEMTAEEKNNIGTFRVNMIDSVKNTVYNNMTSLIGNKEHTAKTTGRFKIMELANSDGIEFGILGDEQRKFPFVKKCILEFSGMNTRAIEFKDMLMNLSYLYHVATHLAEMRKNNDPNVEQFLANHNLHAVTPSTNINISAVQSEAMRDVYADHEPLLYRKQMTNDLHHEKTQIKKREREGDNLGNAAPVRKFWPKTLEKTTKDLKNYLSISATPTEPANSHDDGPTKRPKPTTKNNRRNTLPDA